MPPELVGQENQIWGYWGEVVEAVQMEAVGTMGAPFLPLRLIQTLQFEEEMVTPSLIMRIRPNALPVLI